MHLNITSINLLLPWKIRKGPTRITVWFLPITWAAINHMPPTFMIITDPTQLLCSTMLTSQCPSNLLSGINLQLLGDTLHVDSVFQKIVVSKITVPTIVISWNLRFPLPSILKVVHLAKELKNRFLRSSYEMQRKNLDLIAMIWKF